MKIFWYRVLTVAVLLLLTVLMCVFLSSYGLSAVLVAAAVSLIMISWVIFSQTLVSGAMVADHKLIRFTKKLKKQLKEASTVYIMGHISSDLDSIGASYGLYYALSRDFNVKMVANKQSTLARPLIDFLNFSDKKCRFYDYCEIENEIDENSLLIVVDTHCPVIMDFKELYERVGKTVIIDHHRRSEDFVDKTGACYMKSTASSACEIVTLILDILGYKKISTVAATALFAGIMLDTKNFIMNTGLNTFRTAAFLRQNRADPILVKKMFSESVDICKRKYEIVSDIELFEDFAVAKTTTEDDCSRIAIAQAADELLEINGVLASFVMCPYGGQIYISARSFGDVDVQKIMAKLGGGGHKTASACQLKTTDFEVAKKRLKTAIKDYLNSRR